MSVPPIFRFSGGEVLGRGLVTSRAIVWENCCGSPPDIYLLGGPLGLNLLGLSPMAKIYAEEVRRLEAVRGVDDPLVQKLRQNQKLYKSMYKPGGCIKKLFKGIGGFFKNTFQAIGKMVTGIIDPRNWIRPSFWRDIVAPVLMNFVPGIGPVLSAAYRWGQAIYRTGKAIYQWEKKSFS